MVFVTNALGFIADWNTYFVMRQASCPRGKMHEVKS